MQLTWLTDGISVGTFVHAPRPCGYVYEEQYVPYPYLQKKLEPFFPLEIDDHYIHCDAREQDKIQQKCGSRGDIMK